MKLKIFTIGCALAFCVQVTLAQQNDSIAFSLSLEELMNIEIVSASKKSESLFDASLSASVLTSDEIRNAGATSIMEALRLIPGLIVRESSNGNYDVHIRGLDNVPPNSLILTSTNTTTLVMINNRPVYNYLQGGTFWESLPIDLNDVERIEVVRGPSSTLYGPNAVSGVINIITRELKTEGLSVWGNGQYGSKNTAIANASVGYKFNGKFDVSLSGNAQSRSRDVRYLDYATYEWVDSPNDLAITNPSEYYPNPDKSMIKYGVNTFVNYTPSEKSKFRLTAGAQDSEAQMVMVDNNGVSNMSTILTNSKYVDLHASTNGINAQVSYTWAVQAPVAGMMGSKYDYNITDASVEYDINLKGLSIKPGLTYREATYNDDPYWNVAAGEGIVAGKQTMKTVGGSVRFDYKLLDERMRFTGGIRFDKFTYPDKVFTSYQGAVSYKLREHNLLRAVYSRAYRSPFIFDTFFSYSQNTPAGPGVFVDYSISGNRNLDLLHSDMLEFGYRTRLRSNVSLDAEVYLTQTQNYTALIRHATMMTPENYPVIASGSVTVENIPLSVRQAGVSLSMTIVVDKFQVKPFVTFQNTTLKDYSPHFTMSNAAPAAENGFDPAINNVNSGIGTERDHKFTPKAYGGAYINYSLSAKFNINMNAYWFSQQTFYQGDNIRYNDGIRGVQHIDGKVILNARLSYKPVNQLNVFVTVKNLLGDKSVEFYQSDETSMMVVGGVNFNF
ncbi:MAG TPA: TonB-dependent receptor [Ohtaekwangia sp.]|nr:TonB-dependent receptor [Ohtaekwangia sp.]